MGGCYLLTIYYRDLKLRSFRTFVKVKTIRVIAIFVNIGRVIFQNTNDEYIYRIVTKKNQLKYKPVD